MFELYVWVILWLIHIQFMYIKRSIYISKDTLLNILAIKSGSLIAWFKKVKRAQDWKLPGIFFLAENMGINSIMIKEGTSDMIGFLVEKEQ